MAKCSKCNCKLGWFGAGVERYYEGKVYCTDCYEKIPKPKNYGKQCCDCVYLGADYNAGIYICKYDHNKYTSKSNRACDNFCEGNNGL